jgi:prophage antirepressor-like protein
MNPLVKFTCEALAGMAVNCIMDGDDPWFKAIDVATALKYTDTDQAIRIHVSDDDIRTQGSLILNPVKSTGLKGNWKIAKYINESGLYCLIFGSEMAEAKVFKHWVTSEVLPAIRKTGFYNSDYHYWRNDPQLGTDDQERCRMVHQLATGREDDLHYKVVAHLRQTYSHCMELIGGIGEHLQTNHAKLDAYFKGYTGGQPDIIIIWGLPNGFQSVLAIELKNPNGKGELNKKQIKYKNTIEQRCKVHTIVSHDYSDVIIQVRDHYHEVFARAKTLAITDKPKHYNFSKNPDPQYWCNKLKNKQGLVDECTKRQIPNSDIRIKTNREIASILITYDTKS